MSATSPLLRTPGCIALAGDWHGNTGFARRAIAEAAARGAEGIVQLGDFGIWPGLSGRLYLQGVNQALEAAGIWLAFIDGNHEDFWQLYTLPVGPDGLRQVRDRIWHIPRGHRWHWAERTWLAAGGAVSLDKKSRRLGTSWWPQETLTSADVDSICAGPADVLISHDAPATAPIPGLSSNWDPEMLALALAHQKILDHIVLQTRPTQIYHGHFHVRYSAHVQLADHAYDVEGLNDDQDIERNLLVLQP